MTLENTPSLYIWMVKVNRLLPSYLQQYLFQIFMNLSMFIDDSHHRLILIQPYYTRRLKVKILTICLYFMHFSMTINKYQSKFAVACFILYKDLFFLYKTPTQASFSYILSCQIFGYFAYLTTTKCDNF